MDIFTDNMPVFLSPQQEYVQMLKLAVEEHQHDVDKSGVPYVEHLLKVSYWLKTDDWQLKAIAVGHDLVEDHPKTVTFYRLSGMGFTDRVINGIRCMTKITGETYEEYKAKVKSNKDSILVKRQDLRHNSDLRRLKGVSDKDMARTIRYLTFYHELDQLVKSW